jgi:uncharacterized lipoprotein YddW (UPF0748 family)
MKSLNLGLCFFIASFAVSCTSSKQARQTAQQQTPSSTPAHPGAMREFRAAWIATVANINWPSKPGLPVDEQKAEALRLLNFLSENNFNAVILQVRPQCDALYPSNLEPWSYYLTGKQGQAPEPFYDPLQFWIDQAHERGIELHVWLNPYRAHHPSGGKEISEQSIVKKKPELVVFLKQGYWWMDPALPETRKQTTDVVMDLVNRYDIDGVHFDDYFYPYWDYNGNQDFPDDSSWNLYQKSGGKLSRNDWRRDAVNILIEDLYKKIKAAKPSVKFGLSPFGIWRPGYPESISGFDQYDKLYADAKLWLNKGWIDYFTPQLYWPINRIAQSFPVLLSWWAGENTMNRHLWPGISIGNDTSLVNQNEIKSQIMITRGMVPESKGVVHWSIGSLTKNPNMTKALRTGPYAQQALVPASPWLDNKAPQAPVFTATPSGNSVEVNWTHPDANDVFHYVIYYSYGGSYNYVIVNKNARSFRIEPPPGQVKIQIVIRKVAVTAVDRNGNESDYKEIEINN